MDGTIAHVLHWYHPCTELVQHKSCNFTALGLHWCTDTVLVPASTLWVLHNLFGLPKEPCATQPGGPSWSNSSHILADPKPILVDSRPTFFEFGKFGQFRAKFGRCRTHFRRFRTIFCQTWRILGHVLVDLRWTILGPNWPNLGRV